jgi:cysteine-S-conjugate beta-lyase
MPTFDELDAITEEQLRATGARKWILGDGAVGAFIAEMDFGAAPAITEALHREVAAANFGYQTPWRVEDLRAATVGYLAARYDWDVAAERIELIPDVLTGLARVLEHFGDGARRVVIPTPTYMPFLTLLPSLGYEVVEVPMVQVDGEHRYDYAALDRALAAAPSVLVHCDPHNPTGRAFRREELRLLEDVVARHGAQVFSDEIWAPLTFAGVDHVPYSTIGERAAAHTVTAISASKGWNLPGLKCAQLVFSNDDDLETWQDVGRWTSGEVGNLGIVATTAAYRDSLGWLDDVRAYLERNARTLEGIVAEQMPDVRITHPEGTYVSWLDVSAYRFPASASHHVLQEAGVLCTDGAASGAAGRGHLRFITATPTPILRAAAERMATALAALR